MGKLVVENQLIHIGEEVEIPIFNSSKWDGIVGLGFSNKDQKKEKKYTLIENLKKNEILKENYFSYHINKENAILSFGEIQKNCANSLKDFDWAPIYIEGGDKEDKDWILKLIDINVRNNKKKRFLKKKNQNNEMNDNPKENPCKNGCKFLIDTGTYLTYVPRIFFDVNKLNNCYFLFNFYI